jgi:hypothetical protein
MYVKVDVMKGVLSFRILVGIPPYPWKFLDFIDSIIFSVSLGVVYFIFMFEQGSLNFYIKTMYRIVMV